MGGGGHLLVHVHSEAQQRDAVHVLELLPEQREVGVQELRDEVRAVAEHGALLRGQSHCGTRAGDEREIAWKPPKTLRPHPRPIRDPGQVRSGIASYHRPSAPLFSVRRQDVRPKHTHSEAQRGHQPVEKLPDPDGA